MWMDARKRCKEMGPATRSVSLRHATSTRSQGAQATANSVLSAATSGCAATAPATRSAQIRPATTMRRLSTCALMLRTAHQQRHAPRQRTGTTGMTPTTTIAHTPHVCGTVTTACVPEHLIATQISMCFLHPTPVWRPQQPKSALPAAAPSLPRAKWLAACLETSVNAVSTAGAPLRPVAVCTTRHSATLMPTVAGRPMLPARRGETCAGMTQGLARAPTDTRPATSIALIPREVSLASARQ